MLLLPMLMKLYHSIIIAPSTKNRRRLLAGGQTDETASVEPLDEIYYSPKPILLLERVSLLASSRFRPRVP